MREKKDILKYIIYIFLLVKISIYFYYRLYKTGKYIPLMEEILQDKLFFFLSFLWIVLLIMIAFILKKIYPENEIIKRAYKSIMNGLIALIIALLARMDQFIFPFYLVFIVSFYFNIK